MSKLLGRIPLMAKLLMFAVLPIVFVAYLTFQLYREESSNVAQMKNYLERIEQTATIARLIDQLQIERRYSFDFALRGASREEMMAQRPVTDSLLMRLQTQHDRSLKGFMKYAFLDDLDSVRNRIDRGSYSNSMVMHFYSSAVFRFNTLTRTPSFYGNELNDVLNDLTMQKLLADMITYQGIISANVFNLLYTREYVPETLFGTLPSYDIYKSYERELLEKADSSSFKKYKWLKEHGSLQPLQLYLSKLFATFKLDNTYDFEQWRMVAVHSLNDLRALQMQHLKRAESSVANYYQKETADRNKTLAFLLLFSALIIATATFVLLSINRSLTELRRGAIALSKGKTDIKMNIASRDAIGSLASSIREIDNKNKELTVAARNIGKGKFATEIHPRSEDDQLGNAIARMRDELLLYTNELQRSREEFSRLADFMPQIVWTADAFGNMTYYNKKWYEIAGFREVGNIQTWIPFLHPDDVGTTLTTWYQSIETGDPFEVEYRFRIVHSGEYRWFLGRALPITNSNNEIEKWFGTATDIHDQKMQKEKLEQLVALRTLDLQRSNEDLQQFAHVASHDLKEPLRKISTFSHRLGAEFGGFLPDKGKTYVEKLQSSSQRMAHMIDSILNYSIINATEQLTEMVDLNLILEGITNDLELLMMQKEASVLYKNLPVVRGTQTLLYQLLYNLVNNALKFSRESVPPVISVKATKVASADVSRHLELKKASEYVHLSIEDNGIGFKQEYAEKMFHVFARLNSREKYEGTGLGLALCKKIVHRHHGAIYATGKEGMGACFHIYLPG